MPRLTTSRSRAMDRHPCRNALLEPLERRVILSITLEGMPDWIEMGPSPVINGQVESIPGANPVIGAVHTVLAHPTDPDILYIGATNGGIWRTENATGVAPIWTPLTDQYPSLSIGAMEFDPTDPTNQTIIAAHGAFSSFLGTRGVLPGLLKTTDGGDSWTVLGNADLNGVAFSGVGPRGLTILAADNGRGAGGGGMWLSTDGGVSFDPISGINGLANGPVFDLITDPGDPMRFYAGVGGTSGGIFRTDNAGTSWVNVTDAAIGGLIGSTTNNIEFAVHNNSGAATNAVYLGVVNNGQLAGFFRSGNLGGSWTPMDLPLTLDGAAITDATNATPIQITSNGHGLSNGQQVTVSGVTGNTAANGTFTITVVDGNNFTLNGSSGNGDYAGGGIWTKITSLQPRSKPGGQGGTHFSIAADPNDPFVVYVGGDRQDGPFTNSVGANDFTGRLFRGDASIAPTGGVPSPQWVPLTHSGTASNSSAPHADSREMVFDANGDLIEVDDGGIYRRTSPQDATGDWFSIIGDLRVTELHDVAWDPVSDQIIGGTQDVGTVQSVFAGVWDTVAKGDGGDVAVDTQSLPGFSIRYSSAQNFGRFRRRTYDNTGAFVAGSEVFPALTVADSGAALVPQFVTPIAINRFDGTRLLIGGLNSLYESLDQGENITEIAPGVSVNGTDTTGLGDRGSAMAYGGRRNGVNNPDVLYIGSGNQVFIRTTAGGAVTATTALPAGAGNIRDIFMDPNDWWVAYAVDNDQVFMTDDAGVTWNDITGGLVATGLRTVTYVAGAAADALLVGGTGGVFRMLTSATGVWSEYGLGLANALVFDMEYSLASDILLAGTMGRGAWVVFDASDTITTEACLNIQGGAADDVIRLRLDADNPLLLNVFFNNNTGTPDEQIALASISCIEINGGAGDDTIIIDGVNGQIGVPGSFLIQGGADDDLILAGGTTGNNVTLNGGAGDDSMIGGTAGDEIIGGDGIDAVDYTARIVDLVITTFDNTANDGAAGEGDNVHDDVEWIFGGAGNDQIIGADVANLIIGNNGDDTLNGLGGDDTLIGGLGDDALSGGDGDDSLIGNAGEDSLSGGAGNDHLEGLADDDLLNGDSGNDSLFGGDGDDNLQGGDGDDHMEGNADDDALVGGDGNDSLLGQGGDDNMLGGAGHDSMLGGDGNDTLGGGDGNDHMEGGAGSDSMLGGEGNDTMLGGADDDYMEGNGGNDSMLGGAGEDDMIGGWSFAGAPDGDDFMDGGDDHDVIAGDNASIVRTETLPGVFARYVVGAAAGTGQGLENNAVIRTVTLFNLDTVIIGGDDTIGGGSGDDTLFGQAGDDSMSGGDGHDDLIGHLGADTIDGGNGDDGILGDNGTITPDLLDGSDEQIIKAQDAKVQATINSAGTRQRFVTLDDAAIGGDDVIIAGAGNDTVHAGAGNDSVQGNDGNDALFGNDGQDTVDGAGGNDVIFGGAGDDALDGGVGADIVAGGAGQDSLTADSDDDRLIDWTGNFNSFIVPGPGLGAKIIIRSASPQMQSFLINLATGLGSNYPEEEIALNAPGS